MSHKPSRNPNQEASAQFTSPRATWPEGVAPVERRGKAGPTRKRKTDRSELTVEIGRTIIVAMAAGNFPSVAARIAGIKPSTLRKWLARGDKGEQPLYADFADKFDRTEAQCEADVVEKWRNSDDPRAQDKFLSKRFRENWGDRADDVGQGPGAQLFQIVFQLIGDPEPAIDASVENQVTKLRAPDQDPDPSLN